MAGTEFAPITIEAVTALPPLYQRASLIAAITHIGPFNYSEWSDIILQSPAKAQAIAQDFLKDLGLLAEGAKAGAGVKFQELISTAPNEYVNLKALNRAEDKRTEEDLKITYTNNPFMKDASSYLFTGVAFAEIVDDTDKDTAESFAAVTDLGHFSRIMQKDLANTDDVKRTVLIDEIGFALERNINATFTHRCNTELYPVPVDAKQESRVAVIEKDPQDRVLSIISERQAPPNISHILSITKPENFSSLNVKVSLGRGITKEQQITSTKELLHHLSSQFENLLLSYPLEKAALIFEKYLYKINCGNMGIQMAITQRVQQDGLQKAKILTIGEPSVIFLKETTKQNLDNGLMEKLRADKTDEEIIEAATKIGLPDSDIPKGLLSPKQKAILIGKARGFAAKSSRSITTTRIVYNKDADAAIGSLIQAPHRIIEFDIDDNESSILIPPSVGRQITESGLISQRFSTLSDATAAFSKAYEGKPVTISHSHDALSNIQIITNEQWSKKTVLSQLENYLGNIDKLLEEYSTLFVSLQYAHFHPTSPRYTQIQEQAADIAQILGEELRERGAIVEGRVLIDEYHTADRLTNWEEYLIMLLARSGSVFQEFIQESSPPMRLLGDAFIRRMLADPATGMHGGTLIHNMPDGSILELWDGALDAQGNPARGRQACVPFNIGMDVGLMNPSLADRLYKYYLQERYPQSVLATAAREEPNTTIHAVIANIMSEPNIEKRNQRRMDAITEVDRKNYAELEEITKDLTSFDLVLLNEFYQKVMTDIKTKTRIPLVTHILETNYNAQQTKAGYMWQTFGFPDVPVYRISFNPEARKIKVLLSSAPQIDPWIEFLDQHEDTIKTLKSNLQIR